MTAETPAKSSGGDLELGFISGVFGVRGELKLFLHNRESDLLRKARPVILVSKTGERREVRLSARDGAGRKVIGRIEGLEDCEAAQALMDWKILMPRAALPDPGKDAFYVGAVIGAAVEVDGVVLGKVVQVHSNGPTDVFEVRLSSGGIGFVPVLKTHVLEIDTPGARVVLAPGALAEE